MKIRVISLLLTIALALAMFLPAAHADTVSANENEAARLRQQIRRVYAAAQRNSGRYSFNGWCGTLVSWQLYLMGIDAGLHGADGKNQYDLYAAQDITCGGYGVKRYPATQYTLKEALNTITRDGTVDAYNILVGFQRTNTAAGQIYGHAVVIHGIVDGMVYFMESYSTSLGGQYWPEGSAIVLPIDTFCDSYNRWTVFDGVIHFGVKTYAQLCTAYGTAMTAMVNENTEALTEPVDEGINEARGTVEQLAAGQQVDVSAIYKTPQGGLWYQLELAGGTGYVPVSAVTVLREMPAGVSVSQPQIPASARRGAGVVLRGNVSSLYGDLTKVQVLVYGEEEEPVLQAEMPVSGKVASLSDYKLDRYLTFRDLDVGTYRIVVLADVANARVEDGAAVMQEQTVKVWESQLRIVTDWKYYYKVSFNGNGGQPDVQQYTQGSDETVSRLPGAVREGYRFDGWSLDPEGTQIVETVDILRNNVTLYAQWTKEYDRTEDPINATGGVWKECAAGFWYEMDGMRLLRRADGSWPVGWYGVDSDRFFFNKAGVALTGWQEINGSAYYFFADGNLATGWQKIDGASYYLGTDGAVRTGWIMLNNRQYYLDETGAMTTGWETIGELECLFGADGVLQMIQRGTAKDGCYVVYDRNAAEQMASEDAKLLLG